MIQLLLLAISLCAVLGVDPDSNSPYFGWEDAHATFYGGADIAGTMGGACGYGNMYTTGYGVDTAAASSHLFKGGLLCGACYEIRCVNGDTWKYCKMPIKPIIITVTNLCPANWNKPSDAGGWCNPPRKHMDLSVPAFKKIAHYEAGIVAIKMRRVPCKRRGGVRFRVGGNPWFLSVNIQNIAGSGDIERVWVMGVKNSIGRKKWIPMYQNWGTTWSKNGYKWKGIALSFRIKARLTGHIVTLPDALPKNWDFGKTYHTRGNMPMPQRKEDNFIPKSVLDRNHME